PLLPFASLSLPVHIVLCRLVRGLLIGLPVHFGPCRLASGLLIGLRRIRGAIVYIGHTSLPCGTARSPCGSRALTFSRRTAGSLSQCLDPCGAAPKSPACHHRQHRAPPGSDCTAHPGRTAAPAPASTASADSRKRRGSGSTHRQSARTDRPGHATPTLDRTRTSVRAAPASTVDATGPTARCGSSCRAPAAAPSAAQPAPSTAAHAHCQGHGQTKAPRPTGLTRAPARPAVAPPTEPGTTRA